MNKLASAMQITGLGCILAAAFMASVLLGLFAVGVLVLALGVALERTDAPGES